MKKIKLNLKIEMITTCHSNGEPIKLYDIFEDIIFLSNDNEWKENICKYIGKKEEEGEDDIIFIEKIKESLLKEYTRKEFYFEIVMWIHSIYYDFRKELLENCKMYQKKKLKKIHTKIDKIKRKYEEIPINLFGIHLFHIINEFLNEKINIDVNTFMRKILENIEFERRWTDYQIKHQSLLISIKSTILSNSSDLSDIFDL